MLQKPQPLYRTASVGWSAHHTMMLDKRRLFSRHRQNLPPLGYPATESQVLEKVFRELSNEYKRISSPRIETQLVCDFSSNNLTLAHVKKFVEWLEGNPVRLYALDLSMNRIISPTWEPILELINRLCAKVKLVSLAGSYLPALEETVELEKVQQARRVSLALPTFGGPVTDWQREWTNIALEFGENAYDTADEGRSVFLEPPSWAFSTVELRHGLSVLFAGQVKTLSPSIIFRPGEAEQLCGDPVLGCHRNSKPCFFWQ